MKLATCLVAAAATTLVAPAIAAADDESPPLSIYGFARLDVLANDSRMSSLDEPAFVLLEPADGEVASELTMTPRLSRIGLTIDRWDVKSGAIYSDGKLELDFAGGDGVNALRLRHAYATLTTRRSEAELLVGQTWDLMSPLFPSAQNDTQLRYAGNLGDRRSQIRISGRPSSRLQVAVAAGAPAVLDTQDLDNDGQIDSQAAAQPMIQWLIEVRDRVRRGNVARIGLSGHVARSELADRTQHTGASVGVHFYIPFNNKVVVLGEGYTGSNLKEVGGGVGLGINPSTAKPVHGTGGWVELALLPTDRHMLSFGGSLDTARRDDLVLGDRSRNGTIYTVLRYKPRPALQLGLEHLYWRTRYHQISTSEANRFDIHFSVFF